MRNNNITRYPRNVALRARLSRLIIQSMLPPPPPFVVIVGAVVVSVFRWCDQPGQTSSALAQRYAAQHNACAPSHCQRGISCGKEVSSVSPTPPSSLPFRLRRSGTIGTATASSHHQRQQQQQQKQQRSAFSHSKHTLHTQCDAPRRLKPFPSTHVHT